MNALHVSFRCFECGAQVIEADGFKDPDTQDIFCAKCANEIGTDCFTTPEEYDDRYNDSVESCLAETIADDLEFEKLRQAQLRDGVVEMRYLKNRRILRLQHKCLTQDQIEALQYLADSPDFDFAQSFKVFAENSSEPQPVALAYYCTKGIKHSIRINKLGITVSHYIMR